MKRVILACFLLCLCARFSVAVPSPQSNFPASRESKCSKGFKECKESLKDFKDADEFMQTKATVFADLNRLENSISTKSNSATARDAHVNRQKTGSGVVYGATVGPNRPSSGQATSAAQAALGESAAGTMSDKQMP